jgi:hypothetical protein
MYLKFILFIIFSLFVLHIIQGQDDEVMVNSNDFEKTFEKEFQKQEKQPIEKKIILGVGSETLPGWFFNPPQSTMHEIYTIGITDPAIPDSLANFQAIERALSLVSLMSGTSVSTMSDNFQGQKGTKYEEITKFKGTNSITGHYTIIDSFITRFNEKVLLLKFEKNNTDSIKVKVEFELYRSQMEAGIGTYFTDNIIAKSKRDTNFIYYNYKQHVNDFMIVSLVNKRPVEIPLAIYEYTNGLQGTADSVKNNIVKLPHRGLWMGYLQSFMESLSFISSNLKSSAKSLGQIEQQAVTGNISRDISNNKMFFSINKISIFEDKLNIFLELRNK